MEKQPKHVEVVVTGRVQGVFFRDSVQRRANGLGLSGFVRNQGDGSVYLEAEGDAAQVEKLVVWCYQGPPRARVDNISVKPGPYRSWQGFSIKW